MWLNGEEIYNSHIPRGAVAGHELLTIHLKEGVNKTLAKIENFGSNWGLDMRVVRPGGELKIKAFDSSEKRVSNNFSETILLI